MPYESPHDPADPILSTVEAVDVSLPIAGIGSRAYAFTIDWHLRAVAAAVWMIGVLLVGRVIGESSGSGGELFLVSIVPAGAIYLLYHPVLETLMHGRTPGKRMAGIRVVARTGGDPGPGAHLLRNVFRLLDSMPGIYAVGIVAMMVSRTQGRVGDLAAGTLVIHDAVAAPGSAVELIATTRLDPNLALLIDETLRRWPQLEQPARAQMAATLLERAGAAVPTWDFERREALKKLLQD